NERTYLAWIRTSLSLVTVGVAIRQLYRVSIDLGNDSDARMQSEQDPLEGKVLGVSFVVLGMVFVAMGLYRYFHSQLLMTKGRFPVSRTMVGACATATLALLIGLLVSMFTDGHRRYQATHKDAAQTHRERASKTHPQPADDKQLPPQPTDNTRGQFSRRQLHDNSWRYNDPAATPVSTDISAEAAEAQDEEDIRDFKAYLEEKSQDMAIEQSAVYFQLKSETDSAQLLQEGGGRTWEQLMEVPVEALRLDMVAGQVSLHELLGIDTQIELPVEIGRNQEEEEEGRVAEVPVREVRPTVNKIPAAALQTTKLMTGGPPKPSFRPAFKPQVVKKPVVQPAAAAQPKPVVAKKPATTAKDDLEAFLDDLI
ncbi:hypothetical protein FBU59_005251, partial [Linderina macrospora]